MVWRSGLGFWVVALDWEYEITAKFASLDTKAFVRSRAMKPMPQAPKGYASWNSRSDMSSSN